MAEITIAMQSYLETIHDLFEKQGGARITDIAAIMQVSKASANNAIMVLAEKGLVLQERYQAVSLTALGEQEAHRMRRNHRTVQRFFEEVLGIEKQAADQDACAIEHIISQRALDSMEAYLSKIRQGKRLNGLEDKDNA